MDTVGRSRPDLGEGDAMPRLTQEEAAAIAGRFIRRKNQPPPPILGIEFRPASRDPTPGSAHDRWFVHFDVRGPEGGAVMDPCTQTVVVNDASGRARLEFQV
jgi:hypothetical protein